MTQHNFHIDPDEPQPGDVIQRVDGEGRPDGRWSKVRTVLSADTDGDTFEVIDKFNQTLFVRRKARRSFRWVEILL